MILLWICIQLHYLVMSPVALLCTSYEINTAATRRFNVRNSKYYLLCVRLSLDSNALSKLYENVLIWSHSVASVNACYVWSAKWKFTINQNSSTYEIYLDKAIEACIGNCSPPPPKPKHYRVLHLTALSPPPPAENTKCPCDKIKAL